MNYRYGMANILAAILLAGCASSGSVENLKMDIDEARSRINSLEKMLGSSREVEKNVRLEIASLRKMNADMQAGLDSNKSDLQAITGKLEDVGISARKPAEELVRYREDSDRRIVMLEDRIVKLQVALDELNKRMKELAGSQPASAQPAVPADTQYLKGLEAFKAGDMAAARTQLTQFMEKNSNHELVPNARYWIGETYYGEKNYEQAILEFQEVVKQYPKKEKAPAALLKQALAFKALKDMKSTVYLLKHLSTEYPKSDEAKKARILMREIR